MPCAIDELQRERVEVRCLGSPLQGASDPPREANSTGLAWSGVDVALGPVGLSKTGRRPESKRRARRVCPRAVTPPKLWTSAVTVNSRVSVGSVEVRHDSKVPHVDCGRTHEVDVAEDPRQSPHVLAFEVGAVRVPQYLDCHEVLSLAEVGREVELGGLEAPLVVAHLTTVDPKSESRLHGLEVQEHLTAAPSRGQREGPAVAPHGVIVGRGAAAVWRGRAGARYGRPDARTPPSPSWRARESCPRRRSSKLGW